MQYDCEIVVVWDVQYDCEIMFGIVRLVVILDGVSRSRGIIVVCVNIGGIVCVCMIVDKN